MLLLKLVLVIFFLGKNYPNYLIIYPLNTESMQDKVAGEVGKIWKYLVLGICWWISYVSHSEKIKTYVLKIVSF